MVLIFYRRKHFNNFQANTSKITFYFRKHHFLFKEIKVRMKNLSADKK